MPRDIERPRDGTRSVQAPGAVGDALSEPNKPDRPLTRARSRMAPIPVDPELLDYRNRIGQQVAAWRDSRQDTRLAAVTTAAPSVFNWRAPLLWIGPLAACGAAGFAGWW